MRAPTDRQEAGQRERTHWNSRDWKNLEKEANRHFKFRCLPFRVLSGLLVRNPQEMAPVYHFKGSVCKAKTKTLHTHSNTVISQRDKALPLLCPGDRSDGVCAGLSPGQEGLTTGQLSLTVHPQASPLKGRTQPCSLSLLSVSSSS